MITEITLQDIEYSSTLTRKDLGKFAVIDNGCWYIKDTEEEAKTLLKLLNS
jgi:hypothetical protein